MKYRQVMLLPAFDIVDDVAGPTTYFNADRIIAVGFPKEDGTVSVRFDNGEGVSVRFVLLINTFRFVDASAYPRAATVPQLRPLVLPSPDGIPQGPWGMHGGQGGDNRNRL